MRTSPSCNCCEPPVDCDVGVTNDIDTNASGSWTPTGTPVTEYTTGSSFALRYTSVDSGSYGWSIECDIEFDFLADGSNYEAGIVGGVLDATNFLYAGLRILWDAVASKWTKQFVVGEVVAGSFNELLSHPWDVSPDLGIENSVTSAIFHVVLCWDGEGELTGKVSPIVGDDTGPTEDVISINGISPPGNKAGIGTRTIDSNTVSFNDFTFKLSNIDALCEICDISCCDGPSLEEILVELSGGSASYYTFSGFSTPVGDVRVQASAFDGTYSLAYDLIRTAFGVDPVGHGGDGICGWSLNFQVDAEYWNGSAWTPCNLYAYLFAGRGPSGEFVAFLRVTNKVASAPSCTSVLFGAANIPTNFPAASFTDSSSEPCEDWTSWQTAGTVAGFSPFTSLSCRYMAA